MQRHPKLLFLVSVFSIGVLGGLAGVLFHTVLMFVIDGVYAGSDVLVALETMPIWLVVSLPALGGLFSGLLIYTTKSSEVYGEGVPAIHRALADTASVVRYRVAPVKLLATIGTIGTGGSGGREGPIIQIGAALGSFVAQVTRQDVWQRETFLLAGAAAAMAATFGTPAAAIVFVVEVLRRPMTIERAAVVITTVLTAVIIAEGFFGYRGLTLGSISPVPFEAGLLGMSIVVGVLAGVVAVLFGQCLRYLRAGFSRLPVPVWIRPAMGGFIVGCFLVFLPQLHEAAFYQFSLDAFSGVEVSVVFLSMLLVAKIIATSVTVGSGGSGGIFAPSLFLGLLVGMLVNSVALQAGFVSSPVLLVVGMAALFAGAAHAPVTAVFLLYEIVDQISILPYLIIGAVTAYFVARFLSTSHMYTHDML